MKSIMTSAPARRKKKIRRETFFEFLCTVPALLAILVLNHYPMVELIRYSFTDWNMLKKNYSYVGLKNWKWLFTTLETNGIFNAFKVTIVYTLVHLALVLALGLLFALLFNRKNKGFSFMRSMLFMPRYIAMSSIAIIFIWIFHESMGVANYTLQEMNLGRVGWFSSPTMALVTITIVTTWKALGYDMMIFLSAMQGISKDYYEAASLDGANRFVTFRKITLPLLAPTTAFLFVTQFIGSMKVFNVVDVMTSGGPNEGTAVVVYKLYDLIFTRYRIDRAATVAVVFFIFLLVVTALTMRWSNRKINYDA